MTLEEFLASTQRKEFGDTGEGWKVRLGELSGLGVGLPVSPLPSAPLAGSWSVWVSVPPSGFLIT